MQTISDFIIDYEFLSKYDLKSLQQNLLLPFANDTIYTKYFKCLGSNTSNIVEKNLIQYIDVSSSDINFFLSDFKHRYDLFSLSKRAVNSENINHTFIEDFFSLLIKNSIKKRASDIHIESSEFLTTIRLRIDGILKVFFNLDKKFNTIISSYIKMYSNLDIAQRRLAQDGRFNFNFDDEKYDFRVSIIPTILGESIVIRILDNKSVEKNISNLNFSKNILSTLKETIKLTQGLILISGPTGSGKTTTLYAILKELNNNTKKIITIEDPVEYKIKNIQQVNINDKIGLSFENILKNILRQDPDIILIGEIRDTFSLKIALQASLTGHLVLASIHSNDCVETISRLFDLDADLFLIANTLKYVISQRLILNICQYCKNKKCEKCNFTGFINRSPIVEVLKINKNISSMIYEKQDLEKIREFLQKNKHKTMFDDGMIKVNEQISTLEELQKIIHL